MKKTLNSSLSKIWKIITASFLNRKNPCLKIFSGPSHTKYEYYLSSFWKPKSGSLNLCKEHALFWEGSLPLLSCSPKVMGHLLCPVESLTKLVEDPFSIDLSFSFKQERSHCLVGHPFPTEKGDPDDGHWYPQPSSLQ